MLISAICFSETDDESNSNSENVPSPVLKSGNPLSSKSSEIKAGGTVKSDNSHAEHKGFVFFTFRDH